MPHCIQAPSARLAPFVEYLWSLHDAPPNARGSVLPSGTLALVIHLDDDEIRVDDPASLRAPRRYSGAVVSGAYGRAFVTEARAHTSAVGVHFRPGGAWPFFDLPLGELADVHADLDALWGKLASELRDRLCSAARAEDRFGVLEAALVRRLDHARAGHAAIAFALRELERGETSVGALAERVGWSRRRLIEVFTAHVGITPKKFGRVRRFQRVLAATQTTSAPSWTRVAQACGYFDQPHLIRDFVEFSGLSPAAFARLRSRDATNHHLRLPE